MYQAAGEVTVLEHVEFFQEDFSVTPCTEALDCMQVYTKICP